MRWFLLGAVALLVAALAVGFGLRETIALRLAERTVARNLGTSLLDELPDGLHLALCGAGSPMAGDPRRSGPCAAIVAGGDLYVVDAGSGAGRSLPALGLPAGRIAAIFLTHFHSDHIDGLGELLLQRWTTGATTSPAPVFGPPGVEEVVEGVNRSYARDSAYRVAHHGEAIVPPAGSGGRARPFEMPVPGAERVVLDADGLRVTALRVDHAPAEPAADSRFDYAGRSIVLSGDTVKSEELARFAEGVDLLVHDALSPALVAALRRGAERAGRANLAKIFADIPDYHATPVEAAQTARAAGAAHLLLYHIVPPLPFAPLEGIFLDGVEEAYDGPVTLGRDGILLRLPAGADAIERSDLL